MADLADLFRMQQDTEGQLLAAFTPKDPHDAAAYHQKFKALLADPTIYMLTIRSDHAIVGSIARFYLEGRAEITYWIDRSFWGLGIGTWALSCLLEAVPERPLFARTAFDNIRSQRILIRNGFVLVGADRGGMLMPVTKKLRNLFIVSPHVDSVPSLF